MARPRSAPYRLRKLSEDPERWQVDFGLLPSGKRPRKVFDSEKEARRWAERKQLQIRRIGVKALQLKDEELIDAAEALEIISDLPNATLAKAARFFVAHGEHSGVETRTVPEVITEYLQEARDCNLRPRSIEDIRNRLTRFQSTFGKVGIHEVTASAVNSWLDGLGLSAVSIKHYRFVAHGLFGYAVERGYVSANPLTSARRGRKRSGRIEDERLPEALAVDDVERLLRAAEKSYPRMVPALAIGFFAGLRTSELRQLDWSAIDLGKRHITVRPEVAKRRRQRLVDISSNLVKWLRSCSQKSGPVAPAGAAYRYQFDRVRTKASIKRWPVNAMRHTFASCHVVHWENEAKTAFQLGHHRGVDVLVAHYRALVDREDAARFWRILPSSASASSDRQTSRQVPCSREEASSSRKKLQND